MDTCTNCGAALRPGAKFCTTCGTRLNSASRANSGWGTPSGDTPDTVQETTVLEAVKPAATEQSASITGGDTKREYDRWTGAYGSSPTPADDPASRFISALEQTPALDTNDKPTDIEAADDADEQPNPAATWVTPPPEAFQSGTGSSWSYQASEPVDTANPADDSGWRAPSSWGQVTESTPDDEPAETGAAGLESADRDDILAWGETPAAADGAEEEGGTEPGERDEFPAWGETSLKADLDADDDATLDATGNAVETTTDHRVAPDAAGFHDGGTREVDYLSGDENIDVDGRETPALSPDDARARAISLVDELRRMVRLMPGGGTPDTGAAAMALTEVSLAVGDFSDLREAITELQEDPRDIQALSNLARMADKIELLLDEHQSLAAAIDTAIQELSGQNEVG